VVTIAIAYEGQLHCVATHEPSRSVLATDAPVDNHGRGQSFSPTDLVATGLGTCMLTVMGIVADRHGWDLAGARVQVDKHMTASGPRRIERLEVTIRVPMDPGDAARRTLEQAAHTCPVRESLLAAIDVPVTFAWG
jgi:putative redox protein